MTPNTKQMNTSSHQMTPPQIVRQNAQSEYDNRMDARNSVRVLVPQRENAVSHRTRLFSDEPESTPDSTVWPHIQDRWLHG